MPVNVAAAEYDAVLFDMDGVLVEGRATPAWVYEQAARDAVSIFDATPTHEQLSTLQQQPYVPSIRACCEALGIDPNAFWNVREQCASARCHRRFEAGKRTVYPDTDALLTLDVPLAVVSNNRATTVRYVSERFFGGLFETERGRDPTIEGFLRRKPETHYLDETLAALGTTDALYVGDRETDILAATEAGIDSAYVRREHNADANLGVAPTFEIETLYDLHGTVSTTTQRGRSEPVHEH